MPKLSEKTIDELNDKVDFSEIYRSADSLYEARSYLNNDMIERFEDLVKKLDEITESYEYEYDDDDENLFDIAEELQSDIMNAQEHLEKIYDILQSVIECYPDPDDEGE